VPSAPFPAPINLSEAAADFGSADFGSADFGDLNPAEIFLEYAPIQQPPYVLAGLGLAIGVLCGLTFAKLVQQRLEGWKQDRLALLPLGTRETTFAYMGVVIGITLFIGGSLSVFGFSLALALLVSFALAVATAGALWVQLEGLMEQVQSGNFKAVDFDNFDQFF
jgi:hypothetical protein